MGIHPDRKRQHVRCFYHDKSHNGVSKSVVTGSFPKWVFKDPRPFTIHSSLAYGTWTGFSPRSRAFCHRTRLCCLSSASSLKMKWIAVSNRFMNSIAAGQSQTTALNPVTSNSPGVIRTGSDGGAAPPGLKITCGMKLDCENVHNNWSINWAAAIESTNTRTRFFSMKSRSVHRQRSPLCSATLVSTK